ncbi:alpha/beta hydrolase [Staphylococcus borealis]|uniref:alpha/beta hydrolase n=1 Tax=Staphylococcus TaxID=1279 RepID=UPI0008A84E45|nr:MULTISPECIES: alpha/beta hydrolase [Staphylococcus]RIO88972.1 alpha/beta hydrolase [Staphylococcus haemolyticus]MDM7883136.1 alpha/beta hydrolase [Staphylococcus borealis]MDY4022092.1 alpha/beta hydrolase [Staphylococcus borealis]OHR83918.1 lipase [Staphylococcus sp. HMSC34C02]PTK67153.1 alpha/beta hydrolase [Staphylococcus borealis]
MNTQKKWAMITGVTIMIVSIVVALGLYHHQQESEKRKQQREKVQINNPNVKLFQNITYNNHLPKSQLDIMMPDDVDKDTQLPVIFWMHGGGYVAGDKQYKNPLLSQIVEQGYVVVNVNYALAPNYKYPTPLIQFDDAIQFIKHNKDRFPIDLNQVIIGGDSAGAQLTSQYVAMQTNSTLRNEMGFEQRFTPSQIKGAIFFGGFYDMKTVRETEFPRIQMFMHSYTGATHWETDFKNISQMSTINQVTKDYPSTYLSVGDADPFYSQNIEFYRKLKEANIPVSTLFYDGSHHLHHQYQFHLDKPESKENMKRVLAFLSRNTSSSGVEQNYQSPFDGSTGSDSHFSLSPY